MFYLTFTLSQEATIRDPAPKQDSKMSKKKTKDSGNRDLIHKREDEFPG